MSRVCLPHLLLGLLERIGIVIGILIGCYDALLLAGYLRVEFLNLVVCRYGVLQLRHRAEQAGAKDLEGAFRLLAQAKLHGEKVEL